MQFHIVDFQAVSVMNLNLLHWQCKVIGNKFKGRCWIVVTNQIEQ